MTVKEVKKAHPELYKLFMDYVKDPNVNVHGTKKPKVSDEFCPRKKFCFSKTKEGGDFWWEIDQLNFKVFYEQKK